MNEDKYIGFDMQPLTSPYIEAFSPLKLLSARQGLKNRAGELPAVPRAALSRLTLPCSGG